MVRVLSRAAGRGVSWEAAVMADSATGDGKFRDLDRDVEMTAHAHQRLLASLDALIDDDSFDVSAPSRLPGWTRGHVLTHLTNSGRGHTGILRAAARGEIAEQYPHGVAGRAADIEAGATRPAAEQRDDLRRSIYELEGEYAASKWIGVGKAPFGEVQITDLPFYRMREVAIHHIDLDIGAEFADLPEMYVRLDLVRMEMQWAARQPMGSTSLPDAAQALQPAARLAWMMGRSTVDGLAPAGIF